MQKILNRNLLVLATVSMLHGLTACQADDLMTEEGSSVFAVDSTSGSVIDNATALQRLDEYCAQDNHKTFLQRVAGLVSFQAGYVSNFGGSGYTYNIAQKDGEDGQPGLFRSNRGEMYSRNGMGMEPPSVNFRHDDLIKAECDVVLRSLSGKSGYEQVEASTGVALSGTAASSKVAASDCLSVKMLSRRFGTKHTVAFCPNAWFQESVTSGSGANSRAQMVIQPN